jgi:hypothetical protein
MKIPQRIGGGADPDGHRQDFDSDGNEDNPVPEKYNDLVFGRRGAVHGEMLFAALPR